MGEVIIDSIAVIVDGLPGQAIINSIEDHTDEIGSDVVFRDDSVQQLPPPVLESAQMVKEVSAIALPALRGMLLDPIMSLVDTACVGQVSTTALAAMAPCTSIFQFVFFALFFLSAATTNLVAINPPKAVYDPAGESSSNI